MAQEINEVGELTKMVKEKVVFNKRELKTLHIRESEGHIFVEYFKISDQGEITETIRIPLSESNFEVAENSIWNAIDETIKRGE